MLQTPAHVVIRVLEIGLLPQAEPQTWRADTIGVPVLGVYTKMPYVPLDNEQFLRGLAPDTTYLSWDEVGHYLMLEKPQEFNAVLLAFLEEKGLLHE